MAKDTISHPHFPKGTEFAKAYGKVMKNDPPKKSEAKKEGGDEN